MNKSQVNKSQVNRQIANRQLPRRTLLQGSLSALGLMLLPAPSQALPEDVQAALRGRFGSRAIKQGRVKVDIPGISENGSSVPLTVSVDSPMTQADHVRTLTVYAERNPLPEVARFQLGPRAGIARVQTRIRMADSQRILAVAEMSDGSLWSGFVFGVVTLAACVL